MSEQIRVETKSTPHITIKDINGSLRLRGWDRNEVRADASREDAMKIDKSGDEVIISANSGVVVRIPNQSEVSIREVNGEALIQSIEGAITVKEVNGQLTLKNLGTVEVDTVSGPFSARQLEGDLTVNSVIGPVTLRDVEGRIKINGVQGPFNYKGASFGLDVRGDGPGTLRLETNPGSTYRVQVNGPLVCRVEPGTSARVKLHSGMQKIRIKTPAVREYLEQSDFEFTLGDGEGEIDLRTDASIDFKGYEDVDEFGEDFSLEMEEEFTQMAEGISQVVSEQIEAQMENLTEHLSSLTENLGAFGGTRVNEDRIRRNIEKAQRRAERQVAKAQRKIETRTRAAVARARRERYRRQMNTDPVSNQERELILDMLAKGTISVDDAEMLLATLEGKDVSPSAPKPPTPPTAPTPPKPVSGTAAEPEEDADEE